ncbi:MAG: hypothetical protein ACJ0FF_02655 [Gammaproteobacteria bacterium]
MKKLEFLFWLQFLLVIVASSHQLSKWFFGIPVLIGLIFAVNLIFSKKFDLNNSINAFFSIFLVGYFLRSVFLLELGSVRFVLDIAMILSSYGLTSTFSNMQISQKGYYFACSLLSIFLIYSLILLLAGIPQIDGISWVFLSGSYHLVAWIGLLLVAILESRKLKVSITPYVLFFVLCLVLGGRTGIVVSTLMLLFKGAVFSSKNVYKRLLFSVFVVGIYFVVEIFSSIEAISGDLGARALLLGQREYIYACFFDNISFSMLIFGYNPSEIGWCIESHIDNISLESSLISLNYNLGIFAVPIIMILISRLKSLYQSKQMLAVIVFALIIRISTGEFVFITPYDWLLLLIFFSSNPVESRVSARSI